MKPWRYIALAGLVGSAPLFIVSILLIHTYYRDRIGFSTQEQQGIAALRPLENLLVLFPRYEALKPAAETGNPAAKNRLLQVEQQIDVNLDEYSNCLSNWQPRDPEFKDRSLAEQRHGKITLKKLGSLWNQARQTEVRSQAQGGFSDALMSAVVAMMREAGDHSNLTLDNNLDSYYLADIVTVALPQMQRQLAETLLKPLENRKGAELSARAAVVETQLLEDGLDRILQDAHVSLDEDKNFYGVSKSLQQNFPPAMEKFSSTSEPFLQWVGRAAAGETDSRAELQTAGWSAQVESLVFWQTTATELDKLLGMRIQAIKSKRTQYCLYLAGTLLAVSMAIIMLIRRFLKARDANLIQTAEVLQAREAQLRLIGDSLPDGMVYEVLREPDGTMRFLYVSAGIEKLNGLTAEAVLRDYNLLHNQIFPEDRPLVLAARVESLSQQKTFHVVARIRRADGAMRWMQFSSTPRQLPDDRVVWDGIETDITDRKHAEEALKESESRFRTLIEKAPIAIAITRRKERVYANQKCLELFGYSELADYLNDSVGSHWSLESQQLIEEYLQLRAQGLPVPSIYEGVAYRKDGSEVTVQIAVTLVSLPEGPSSISFLTDISERKRNERQIQHLNRVYAVLSDINQTIVREKDPKKMLQSACKIAVEKGKFVMSWAGMLDRKTQVLVPVAAEGKVEGYMDFLKIKLGDKALEKGPAARAITSGIHAICNNIERDPDYAPWREEAVRRGYRSSGGFPLKVDGEVVGVFSLYAGEADFFNKDELALLDELAMDISFALEFHEGEGRRQRAENAVKQSEARFAKIFHSSPVPIGLSRRDDGKYIDANASFLRLSGFTYDEVVGRTALEMGIYADASQRPVILNELKERGYIHRFEHKFRVKSGEVRNVLLWVEVISVGQTEYLLTMGLDITEQKQMEAQLRQAQKLEALGTLAGGIAHDFNNILGAIISFTELCRMDNPENTELIENLDHVLKASRRATNLVRQILSFSRQQKHEYAHMQLGPVVVEALKLLRATLPATITIEHHIPAMLPDVHANGTQIHQVIMNLCTNAAHAMKDRHGKLDVGLDLLRLMDSDTCPHIDLTPGDYVRLRVSDTGHGMDEATLKHIFEPFFTTKAPGEGTGLGLAVVHGIIKEHGGAITVESSPGQGTTFTLYFPAARASQAIDGHEMAPLARGNGERILFVDDEPALCEAAGKMIRRLGFEPVIFQSSELAWKAIEQNPGACDVLISDLTMPVMTGMDLARRVLNVSPGMPIILVTGFNGIITKTKALEKGVSDLLVKPLDYESLGTVLDRVLSQKSK